MSCDLEFSLKNVWFLGVFLCLIQMILMSVKPELRKIMTDMSCYTFKERFAGFISMFIMYGFIGISFWVSFSDNFFMIIVGILIYLSGVILAAISVITYSYSDPNKIVSCGIYSLSRNPMYLFSSISFLGICAVSSSIILFVIWNVYNVVVHLVIISEERKCIRDYGDLYREYMNITPRYFSFKNKAKKC